MTGKSGCIACDAASPPYRRQRSRCRYRQGWRGWPRPRCGCKGGLDPPISAVPASGPAASGAVRPVPDCWQSFAAKAVRPAARAGPSAAPRAPPPQDRPYRADQAPRQPALSRQKPPLVVTFPSGVRGWGPAQRRGLPRGRHHPRHAPRTAETPYQNEGRCST